MNGIGFGDRPPKFFVPRSITMSGAFGVRRSVFAAWGTLLAMVLATGSALGRQSVPPTKDSASHSGLTIVTARPSPDAIRAVRRLQREHFGRMREPDRRAGGRRIIASESDPGRLMAMAMLLRDEADDVRLALLERLATVAGSGHAILTWIAIVDDDPRLRGAATMRITSPDATEVHLMLRAALGDGTPIQQDRAAELAAWLGATDLLPGLIDRLVGCRQVRGDHREGGVGIGLGVGLVLVAGVPDAGGSFRGPASRIGLAAGTPWQPAACNRISCGPRPAIHAAVLALSRRLGGPDTPDHGLDRLRWHAWLAATEERSPRP